MRIAPEIESSIPFVEFWHKRKNSFAYYFVKKKGSSVNISIRSSTAKD